MSLNQLINTHKKEFDFFYRNLLKGILKKDQLSRSMIYGSMNGGKRIRPFLVQKFGTIAKVNKRQILRISSAVECIHSYSLIHDDLPSMDNDDFRRGKLSTHKKFNESTAILAGDALHDLAFEIISDKKTHSSPQIRIEIIKNLSIAIGFNGLAGGQSQDLLYENKNISISKIIKMYEMKTAALFSFACMVPFMMANKSKKEIKFAQNFGKLFGLIFQIVDDIIDAKKDFKYLGKTPGKDKKQGKSTLSIAINKKNLKKLCNLKINKFKNENKDYFFKYPILNDLIYFNISELN